MCAMLAMRVLRCFESMHKCTTFYLLFSLMSYQLSMSLINESYDVLYFFI